MGSAWHGSASETSAQHPDLLALDQVEIDVGAETGFGRGVDEAVAVDGDVFGEAVFLHCVRQQDLEEFGVADRHDDMEVGDIVSELPPWCTSKFMRKASARWAV